MVVSLLDEGKALVILDGLAGVDKETELQRLLDGKVTISSPHSKYLFRRVVVCDNTDNSLKFDDLVNEPATGFG